MTKTRTATAAKAMTPRQADVVSLAHLHTPAVSVREQAALLVDHGAGDRDVALEEVPHQDTPQHALVREIAIVEAM